MALHETGEKKERLILVGVSLDRPMAGLYTTAGQDDTADSLLELAELVETAGAEAVGTVIQNREAIHPGTYIGKGKIEEVKQLLWGEEADGIVCDDELSPAQMKNLEEELDTKVMDRTMVILDIFAARAATKEGKIQVELAQLKYRSSRLIGLRNLSRLGGGIGTRGPGEKKLEVDRRLIRSRIAQLNRELKEVVQARETTRKQRSRTRIPLFSIVGYTNAGKSTLLNALTGSEVLEMDQLFATLDPTTRGLELASGEQVLLTDTVGFIRKLPHHLIDAFRSTLEEAKYADAILHVVDCSNPDAERQIHIVYDTLHGLGIGDKKVITVFNKCDREEADRELKDLRADRTVYVSAKQGMGLEQLKKLLEEILREQKILIEQVFSYQEAGKIQQIRSKGQLLTEEYREDGIFVKAWLPKETYQQLRSHNR